MRGFALKRLAVVTVGIVVAGLMPDTAVASAGSWIDKLNRGVISVHTADGNRVSWRLLADDPAGVAFSVYRDGTRVTSAPLSGPTSFLDVGASAGARYAVRAVVGGVERMSAFAEGIR